MVEVRPEEYREVIIDLLNRIERSLDGKIEYESVLKKIREIRDRLNDVKVYRLEPGHLIYWSGNERGAATSLEEDRVVHRDPRGYEYSSEALYEGKEIHLLGRYSGHTDYGYLVFDREGNYLGTKQMGHDTTVSRLHGLIFRDPRAKKGEKRAIYVHFGRNPPRIYKRAVI